LVLIYVKTLKLAINSNHPMGFINRTSWAPQDIPLLSLPREEWDEKQLVPKIPFFKGIDLKGGGEDTWVDVIINNLDDGSHPFHLHGYSFYIVSTYRSTHGWGSYNPYSSSSSTPTPVFNLYNPLRKDTVSVPRRGYTVIRFRPDNEGLWMLHCHVLVHLGSGMAMGLQIGGSEGKGVIMDERAGELCNQVID
jgi:hypothetical protein